MTKKYIYIIVHDTQRRDEERGKRRRKRLPFQKIVHFFYIFSVARLLHGGRRYLKVSLPGLGGGNGRVEQGGGGERVSYVLLCFFFSSYIIPPLP